MNAIAEECVMRRWEIHSVHSAANELLEINSRILPKIDRTHKRYSALVCVCVYGTDRSAGDLSFLSFRRRKKHPTAWCSRMFASCVLRLRSEFR